MPRVLVVEHEATCPPALFGSWLEDAGCEVVVCRPYAGDPLPTLAEYDALLVLGGSMAATDTHAWLAPLRDLVRDAAADEVPTLGICLGHQVCAVAFGGTAEPNPRGQQLGLLDIGWTAEAAADPLLGPLSTPRRAVQWNDDLVIRLPDDAVALAAHAGRRDPGGPVRADGLGRAVAPRGRPGGARCVGARRRGAARGRRDRPGAAARRHRRCACGARAVVAAARRGPRRARAWRRDDAASSGDRQRPRSDAAATGTGNLVRLGFQDADAALADLRLLGPDVEPLLAPLSHDRRPRCGARRAGPTP